MDRVLPKKTWTSKRVACLIALLFILSAIIYLLFFADHSTRLNIQSERLTISVVERGDFLEWIPVNGTIQPIRTVFLDAIEGGRVEELLTEEGSLVKAGKPIVRLSNTNLLLDIMYREAELFQQINELRNTRLAMDQHRLELRGTMMDLDYRISNQKRKTDRAIEMTSSGLISSEEMIQAREEYDYLLAKRELTLDTYYQDSLFRSVQMGSMEESVRRMQANLDIVRQKIDNLTIKAPIDGQLTSLDAEIGQLKPQGVRIGQIDVLDGFKVRCEIDEHYISRIMNGQTGTFRYADEVNKLEVAKVYPEVVSGRFEIDMEFLGEEPEDIRRGQTLRIQLELGDPVQAVMLKRGGFFHNTGGRWVFVVSDNDQLAVRRQVRFGRQNTTMLEVLDGLEPGERVITSSYDDYGDVDKLVLRVESNLSRP